MARRRKTFVLESNVDKITKQINNVPYKVMPILGRNITREIKSTTLKSQYSQRTKILQKTLGYWARKRERDLQIGFKMSITKNDSGAGSGIVGGIITGQEPDPIKPVVIKNKDIIVNAIAEALRAIGKR